MDGGGGGVWGPGRGCSVPRQVRAPLGSTGLGTERRLRGPPPPPSAPRSGSRPHGRAGRPARRPLPSCCSAAATASAGLARRRGQREKLAEGRGRLSARSLGQGRSGAGARRAATKRPGAALRQVAGGRGLQPRRCRRRARFVVVVSQVRAPLSRKPRAGSASRAAHLTRGSSAPPTTAARGFPRTPGRSSRPPRAARRGEPLGPRHQLSWRQPVLFWPHPEDLGRVPPSQELSLRKLASA